MVDDTDYNPLIELAKLDEEYLMEMAIINPSRCKHLKVQVEVEQRNEGSIPHLHVYHNKSRNPKECSYVRLDKAAYCEHHRDAPKLPRDLKEEFIFLMKEEWPKQHFQNPKTGDIKRATGYEAAVNIWVDTFTDDDYSKFSFDDTGNLIMPDYSQL